MTVSLEGIGTLKGKEYKKEVESRIKDAAVYHVNQETGLCNASEPDTQYGPGDISVTLE
jgi:hypothetical protein